MVKGASAVYEMAPLPDGRYAVQFELNYLCGNGSGSSSPWEAFNTRPDCVEAFLAAARKHFGKAEQGTQGKTQRAMWKLLDPAKPFVEPKARKR